jgi:hypothetical protein
MRLTGPESLGACSASPLYFAEARCLPGSSLTFTVTLDPVNGTGTDDAPSTENTTVPVAGGAPAVRCASDTRADIVTGLAAVAVFDTESFVTVAA